MPAASSDPRVLLIVLALLVGAIAIEKIREYRRVEPGTREFVHKQYREGAIGLEEMERRLGVIEDPEADRIRSATERISGIGEETSWGLAAEFDTIEELREAEVETLTDVPNVGEKRAESIRERLS